MTSIHYWSEEEDNFLRKNIKGRLCNELQIMLKNEFDITVTPKQISSHIKRLGLTSGVNTRFKKGLEAHNKGKRMEIEVYSKCAPTMFKPGRKPNNVDSIGTEKMAADGYVWVKIDDKPKVPKVVNWKQKHRIVWEQWHGPIPEGHMIIFLDGDHENFDIDNLDIITKSENLIMNRKGLYKSDRDVTKSGVQLAKLVDSVNKKTVKNC